MIPTDDAASMVAQLTEESRVVRLPLSLDRY